MNKKIKLSNLARALVNGEFLFYYQPIISLFSGKICGAESLLRWKLSDGSIIPPGAFIPLAETTGFITEITQEMLPKVVNDLSVLNQIDDSLFVSFNVSAKDFEDEDFLETLFRATANLNNRENLFIEITETSFLPASAHTHKVLQDIHNSGISIILNDFSAGHTTLSTLTQMPLKAIKIALEITQRAPLSQRDFRLFRHLVSMAHQLRLDIIAEGVENEETHTLMLSSGCTHTQGYFYGRPVPLSDFIHLLDNKYIWSDYPFGLEYLAQFDHIDFRRDIIRAVMMIHHNPETDIRERALARLPELDAKKCLFGEWYQKVGYLNKGTEAFKQIGREHQEFHELAKILLEKALAGERWESLEKLIALFSEKSKRVMYLIQDLEIEKLKDYFNPD